MIDSYVLIHCIIREDPSPKRTLNNGPAMEPANPISPYPILASAMLTVKSKVSVENLPGTEFPKARRVIPKKESGTLRIIPNVLRMSTRMLEMNHIQKIDMIIVKMHTS